MAMHHLGIGLYDLRELFAVPFTLPIIAVVMGFLWLSIRAISADAARSSQTAQRYKFLSKALEKGLLRREDLDAALKGETRSRKEPAAVSEVRAERAAEPAVSAAESCGAWQKPSKAELTTMSTSDRLVHERECALKSGFTLMTLAFGLAAGALLTESEPLLLPAAILGALGLGRAGYAMARREVIQRIRDDVERTTPR